MRVLSQVVHSITSVFGCRHNRLSRPFTIQNQSYMVCLECGRKVFYSMQEMRRLSRGEVRRMTQPRPAIELSRLTAGNRHGTVPETVPASVPATLAKKKKGTGLAA